MRMAGKYLNFGFMPIITISCLSLYILYVTCIRFNIGSNKLDFFLITGLKYKTVNLKLVIFKFSEKH